MYKRITISYINIALMMKKHYLLYLTGFKNNTIFLGVIGN